MVQKSQTTGKIAKALLDFHKEIGVIAKNSTNPFFKSKYADLPTILEEIKEPLEKSGLSFGQFPDEENLVTIIFAGDEWVESSYPISPAKKDPQGIGSAITYARRYALCAILGLSVDDDDGNMATHGRSSPMQKAKEDFAWLNPDVFNGDSFQTWLKTQKKNNVDTESVMALTLKKYRVSEENKKKIVEMYDKI